MDEPKSPAMREVSINHSIDDAPMKVGLDAIEFDRQRLADHTVRSVTAY